MIHADLVEKIDPPSLGKAEYILTTLDDASSGSCVLSLKKKSDTAKNFIKINNQISTKSTTGGQKVSTDRGTENFITALKDFFAVNGINHEPNSSFSPESDRKAERLNRTIIEPHEGNRFQN